jgi:acyl carrier protein
VSDELERVVVAAIASTGHTEPVDLDARWRNLGVDSLDLLDVVLQVERSVGQDVPDEVAVRLFTPRDLIGALRRLGPPPAGPVIGGDGERLPVTVAGAARQRVCAHRGSR